VTVSELRLVLGRHGLTPGRRLGQHFLCDPNILRRIVDAAEIVPGDPVLEVGPGVGVLTRELARAGARVTAVELDRSLRPALLDVLGPEARRGTEPDGQPSLTAGAAVLPGRFAEVVGDRVRILWMDAVDLPWGLLSSTIPGPWRVCSNLPYYITGPFLASLFAGDLPWASAVLLVQAEAAERMKASPGTKAYGAFTCLVGYHAEVERVLSVPRRAFLPPPNVLSAVVRLRRRTTPPTAAPRAALLRVVRAAFSQRRKTLRNALASGLSVERSPLEDALGAAGIVAERRGETLDLVEFGRLTQTLLAAGLIAGDA